MVYFVRMYNWSVDEKAVKKANPETYQIWRLEQLINYGLDGERLSADMVRRYFDRIYIDIPTRRYLKFLLWPKNRKQKFSPKSR